MLLKQLNGKCQIRLLLTLGITFLALCNLGNFIAYAESSTEQSRSKSKLEGVVTDIVTRQPVSGVTVSITGQSCLTDARGHYSIANLKPGTNRMEITGDSIIQRSLMVDHQALSSLDVTVKMSNFNNAMFWASAGLRGKVRRWHTPPKWVVYSHVLDSNPPKVFASKERSYLLNIIRKELLMISSFFRNPKVEMFKGRPNDDPRWTGKKSAKGYILCAPDKKGGGYTNWPSSGRWFNQAKIRVNYLRARKVWRHEIAHALGMGHAFDNKKWLPLGVKDTNYRPTKLHQGVMFQDWDKLWLHCVYSGSRPSGNLPPDRDPDTFIYGKTSLFSDPNSVFKVDKQKTQK